jgi:hypothetical protein
MARNKTSYNWIVREYYDLPYGATDNVTEAENMAYAKGLLICAKGDGTISPQEREWVVGFLTTTGVSSSVVEMAKTYDGEDTIEDVLKVSPAMPSYRHAMLYDALRCCASDGELHPEERARIGRMADVIGVSRELLAELEQLVQDDDKLRKRRHKLIILDASVAQG